jgi:hypothetical protein
MIGRTERQVNHMHAQGHASDSQGGQRIVAGERALIETLLGETDEAGGQEG